MKKKYFLLILMICVFFTGCAKKTDTDRFINEYESLNGKINEKGIEYRELDLDDDVNIVYKSEDDIVNAIENEETFIVYFGFASCPWCRSVVPTFLEVAEDKDLHQIYYVDIKTIRDTLKIGNDGEIETVNEGTEGYYRLLELFDNVLNNYVVNDNKNIEVDVKEKRIYAPSMISVVNGDTKMMVSGISDYQVDPNEKLTKKIVEDMEDKFEKLIDSLHEGNMCTNLGC